MRETLLQAVDQQLAVGQRVTKEREEKANVK